MCFNFLYFYALFFVALLMPAEAEVFKQKEVYRVEEIPNLYYVRDLSKTKKNSLEDAVYFDDKNLDLAAARILALLRFSDKESMEFLGMQFQFEGLADKVCSQTIELKFPNISVKEIDSKINIKSSRSINEFYRDRINYTKFTFFREAKQYKVVEGLFSCMDTKGLRFATTQILSLPQYHKSIKFLLQSFHSSRMAKLDENSLESRRESVLDSEVKKIRKLRTYYSYLMCKKFNLYRSWLNNKGGLDVFYSDKNIVFKELKQIVKDILVDCKVDSSLTAKKLEELYSGKIFSQYLYAN